MVILLIVIIILLCAIIYIEREKRIKLKADLRYIDAKLNEIMSNDTIERVRLVTTDEDVKRVLITINYLLDYNHQNHIKYNKARISMKKMLSNVSHDLKTPMTVILGYLELLQMKYKEDESIDRAYKKSQEVIELINKFFDLAKLESGDKQLPMEKVDLSEICRTIILDYYNTLQSKQFEVDIQVPEEPIYIWGNRGALGRILNNLISNAIKYGDAGKYLGLYVSEDHESVTVEVIDKGKGIKEQYKEEVFERMYTLEDSRSRAYQGSGLGLTITKELVEQLGGEIHLMSKPYEKTIFSFKLNKLTY